MDRSSQDKLRQYPYLRGHLLLVLGQIVLAVLATLSLGDYPDPGFTVNDELVVTRVDSRRDQTMVPEEGWRILAIGGAEVDTLPEYWMKLRLLQDEEDGLITVVERYNYKIPMSMSAADFEKGLPSSLREGDTPVGFRCMEDPAYASIAGLDMNALKGMLQQHAQDRKAIVVVNRPVGRLSQPVEVQPEPSGYVGGGLLLLGAVMMVLVLLQAVRCPPPRDREMATRAFYLSTQILFLSLAGVGLAMGLRLMSQPLLFVGACVGLALFKPVNLEMHLRHRSGWTDLGLPTRLSVYVGPVIFLAQLLIASVSLFMLTVERWGGDLTPDDVIYIEDLWTLLLGGIALMIVIDAGLLIMRHQRRGEGRGLSAVASRIGLGFSLAAVLVAIYLFIRGDGVEGAGHALLAAMGLQLLGDVVGVMELPRDYWRSSDPSQLFSRDGVQTFLRETQAALPGGLTFLVTQLDAETMVRFWLEPRETGELQLSMGLAPDHWRDLVDVLYTEGGFIPRLGRDPEAEPDPVEAMAHRLGIYLLLPLPSALSSVASRSVLVAAADLETDPEWEPPPPEMLPLPHLQALVSSFEDFEPSVVFQATRAAYALSDRPRDEPEASAEAESTAEAVAADAMPSAERAVLLARLRAMEAEIHRLHPIDDVETTRAQEEAADAIASASGPVLIVGEAGVGKTLVARIATAREGRGPFIRLAASELPAAVLELELFGSDAAPGRFQAARGGCLIIESAERVGDALYARLFEETEALPDEERPRLVLSYDTDRSVELEDFTPWSEAVDAALAAVIPIRPLRDQAEDIGELAKHFLHRSAMRHDKVITDFAEAALEQLRGYDWPGNLRELRDVIERAVLMCEGRTLTVADLQLGPAAGVTDEAELDQVRAQFTRKLEEKNRAINALEARVIHLEEQHNRVEREREELESLSRAQAPREELEALKDELSELRDERASLEQERERLMREAAKVHDLAEERNELIDQIAALKDKHERDEDDPDAGLTEDDGPDSILDASYEEVERRLLARALERTEGNKSAAARELGLKRSTFINKLKKYDLG